MESILQLKTGVNWDVHPAIEKAQDTIQQVYGHAGATAYVTSAKDGVHSGNSAHNQANNYPARGIDLRIIHLFPRVKAVNASEWWRCVRLFATGLAGEIALSGIGAEHQGAFYVVVEKDHLHLEFSETTPNIRGFAKGRHVYLTEGVKALMATA